ncbi:hypothetical protein ACKWTF_016099 [Chironomus riparius]
MSHQISSLNSLPEELLIEIFEYLPAWSLIQLTKCSKFLNTFVSSNNNLLSKIEVLLTENKNNKNWIGSRKYSKIKFSRCDLNQFNFIFIDIGESIKEMTLQDCQINANYFKKLLTKCENLRILDLVNQDEPIDFKLVDFLDPLPKLKLKKLSLTAVNGIFNILIKCRISDLEVHLKHKDSIFGYKEFIEMQKKLKSLTIINYTEDIKFFETDYLNVVDFRLESLTLKNIKNFESIHFEEFLLNHRKRLKSLTIDHCNASILTLFRDFKDIKNLTISYMWIDSINLRLSFIQSVKSLTVNNVSGNWSAKFTNLQNLHIENCVVYQNHIDHFEKLNNLTIKCCAMPEIILPPNVETLVLNFVDFFDCKPFTYELCNIKYLKIEDCEDVEWLSDYLRHGHVKLEHLRIKHTKLNKEFMKKVEKNLHKVKMFEKINHLMIKVSTY